MTEGVIAMSTCIFTVENVKLLDGRHLGLAKARVFRPDPGNRLSDWSGEIDLNCDAEVVHELRSAFFDETIVQTSIGHLKISNVSGGGCLFQGSGEPFGDLAEAIDCG